MLLRLIVIPIFLSTLILVSWMLVQTGIGKHASLSVGFVISIGVGRIWILYIKTRFP